MKKTYNKTFHIKVAKEALLPENQGMEHIIAKKYGLLPGTVHRWKDAYTQYGEDAFAKGHMKTYHKSSREKELEKENKQLREEVEILKKAAAFLADLRRE